MRQEVKDYLDLILNQGLENGYWFMTKQKMDYYFIFTQAKVVETFNSQRRPNENFGSYYSRFFRENEELNAKYPTQGTSDDTYRNAISAESLGFFYREKAGYETGIVTDAYRAIARYVHNLSDANKYAYLFERQVEKLCLNVNPTLGNYTNLCSVRNFPTMFLYKILYELKKRCGDSKLYYDEFVVFLVRAKKYSDWESVLNLILWKREEGLEDSYKEKYDLIFNDVTSDNIRFDALLGKLNNIEYTDKKHGYYFKIKDSIESFRYIENAIEIFEASSYSNENNAANLLEFLRSDKYFIGNLDAASIVVDDGTHDGESGDEETLNLDTCERNKDGTNVILYGVPGAGKSWAIKEEYCDDESRMERLVFHPDYTYSDFVGQIMPVVSDDGSVSYAFNPGPFSKLVRKAYQNPDKHYYLIIEEVNRGNAPAIFGDIFQLLDRKKDGSSEYAITNADIARVVYGNESHKVSIPSNMSILCTMNTSDQNVFTLDTAFQRRWNMRLIQNKFREGEEKEQEFAKTKILDTAVTWEKFYTEINKIILDKNIRMTSSEDKRLGTHFVSIEDLKYEEGNNKQNSKFPEKVLKYLRDDAFKFTKEDVFDLEKVKSLEDVIELFLTAKGNDRFRVFKENIFNTIVVKTDSDIDGSNNN